MLADTGGAVGDEGVVPLGPVAQPVHLAQVVEENGAGQGRPHLERIEVDLLPAHIGAQADDVAFVGDHVDPLVLAEKALDRGVALALFLAGLDGEAHVSRLAEAETGDGVGNARRPPGDDEQVHGLQAGQVVGAGLPAAGVVGFGAVVAVAHPVDGDRVVGEFRPGEHGHVRLPVALVRRDAGEKPGKHRGEQDHRQDQPLPSIGPDERRQQRAERIEEDGRDPRRQGQGREPEDVSGPGHGQQEERPLAGQEK